MNIQLQSAISDYTDGECVIASEQRYLDLRKTKGLLARLLKLSSAANLTDVEKANLMVELMIIEVKRSRQDGIRHASNVIQNLKAE